jgi:hypothetical protein
LGLSTFNDGRGIFDWNVVLVADVVPGVFIVGGGDGATTTDGEIARLIVPDRFPWFNFGLATITGLLDLAAAVALANTFDTGGLRGGAAGDAALVICGLGDGNLAVTIEDAFRCVGVGLVLVNKELIRRDIVERNVSVGWVLTGAAVVWTIGCVKVFDARLDIVITQSRALLLFECILIVDVFNCSSIFAGIAGGL